MIRALTPADIPWVLALNEANETETAPLEGDALAAMMAQAFQAAAIGQEAFLLAFAPGASYASLNYRWFAARFAAFAYVDRVVVAEAARGKGFGRMLYEGLFAACAAHALPFVGCEVNIDPPNPVSDRFHAALGFAEIGRAELPNGKIVRYLSRPIGSD